MNARKSKALRRLAASLVTADAGMHDKAGTLRVKTDTDFDGKVRGRVTTRTLVNRKGSFRQVLRALKRDEVGTLQALGVIA